MRITLPRGSRDISSRRRRPVAPVLAVVLGMTPLLTACWLSSGGPPATPTPLAVVAEATTIASAPAAEPTRSSPTAKWSSAMTAASDATASPTWSWDALLARSLQMPSIDSQGTCPVTPATPATNALRLAGFGASLGDGPVYPVSPWNDSSMPFESYGPNGWSLQKILWVVDPAYGGPILVRGRQLDGPDEVRFSPDLPADPTVLSPSDMRLDAGAERPATGADTWANWASYVRFHEPGCYAFQADGITFSEVLIFRITGG